MVLRQKVSQLTAMLDEHGSEEQTETTELSGHASVSGPSKRTIVKFPDHRGEIVVEIGTSQHAQVPGLVDRISDIVDAAYSRVGKRKRVDHDDAIHRLGMGDDGPMANRVLHLAFKGQSLVGCASSTFSPGWTPEGCGHWGLMAVDPAHQGGGVATALVLAAERRLATASGAIQIEYSYTKDDEFSNRLMAWYEDRLGFDGGPRGRSGFRHCFKEIPECEQLAGERRRIEEVRDWLSGQLADAEASAKADGAIDVGTP
jgi:GNAT superfamily N-acetyltransferase